MHPGVQSIALRARTISPPAPTSTAATHRDAVNLPSDGNALPVLRELISVVILTCNEAHHLPGCLAALPRGLPVLVVDSGSRDDTVAIAQAHGCRVATHPWEGFAAQRNFAMESGGIETPWVLFVDADETYPATFFEWFVREVADDLAVDAVIAPSRLFLRARRLDHAPGYPIYHPRVIRRGRLRFLTNHTGHGESIPADAVTRIAPVPYDHHFYQGEIIAWMHKHVGKAAMEVALKPTCGAQLTRRGRLSLMFGRSWLRIPARFAYHYLLRGGFRDGRAGLEFALMFAWYEATIYLQRMANRANHEAATSQPEVAVIATHIPPALGYGGVSVTAGVLTRAWSALGHRIALCASDESMERRLRVEDVRLGEGVAVELYHCYGLRRWGFGLGALGCVLRTCRRAPVAYIHGIATFPVTLAALVCQLLGRRYVIAPHGGLMPEHVAHVRAHKPHKWLYYRWLTLPALRRAVAVHCTSDTEAEGIRELLGDAARIAVIANGVDLAAMQALPAPDPGPRTLLFLGHILPEKGINGFIKAWREVRAPGERLIVAGRSYRHPYSEAFYQLMAESAGAIEYCGYLDRAGVTAALKKSHFLVLPSGLDGGGMRENFGNVVAEALAAGRPALVARGLYWDGLEPAGAGFVFEREAASVQATLARASQLSAQEWEALSRAARRYAETHFDAVRLGAKVWELLSAPKDTEVACVPR